MPKMPKIPQISNPNMPTQASFITRGTSGAQQNYGGPRRPLNPIVGSTRSNTGSPSLLGGM